MHWAVKRDSVEMVKMLIFYNAFINAQDYNGKTPLHVACINKNWDIVKVI